MSELKNYLKRKFNLSDEDYAVLVEKEKQRISTPVFDYTNVTLNEAKSLKVNEIKYKYKSELTDGVTSSLTGEDGNAIIFRYSETDQLNYSKRANTLALNPDVTEFKLGTQSHGVVTLTKDDFLAFMADADAHEMALYEKLDNLRSQVDTATTVDEVKAITW